MMLLRFVIAKIQLCIFDSFQSCHCFCMMHQVSSVASVETLQPSVAPDVDLDEDLAELQPSVAPDEASVGDAPEAPVEQGGGGGRDAPEALVGDAPEALVGDGGRDAPEAPVGDAPLPPNPEEEQVRESQQHGVLEEQGVVVFQIKFLNLSKFTPCSASLIGLDPLPPFPFAAFSLSRQAQPSELAEAEGRGGAAAKGKAKGKATGKAKGKAKAVKAKAVKTVKAKPAPKPKEDDMFAQLKKKVASDVANSKKMWKQSDKELKKSKAENDRLKTQIATFAHRHPDREISKEFDPNDLLRIPSRRSFCVDQSSRAQ